ncbi:MAG TPA: hypothetical protein VNL72_01755 [Gammaproteobacteria bacterium]|nr:hypothetical protein [Gammaproteobacteria bacterium]
MARENRRKSGSDVPVLREVVAPSPTPPAAASLPNLDLFADPARGAPDPNALRNELIALLNERIEQAAQAAARDAARRVSERLRAELPALIDALLTRHFSGR